MKKSIYTLTGLAVLIALSLTLTQFGFADRSEQDFEKQLNRVFDKHGDDCIYSFYSIDEIRPYSILQLEETMALYNNQWLPPQKYMEQLDSKDKKFLIEKLAVYLASLKEDEANRIMHKINNWCVIQDQLSIIEEMDINDKLMLTAFYKLDDTKHIFEQFSKSGELKLDEMTADEKKQAFVETMNILADLDSREQLNYYSKMFNQLYLSMK